MKFWTRKLPTKEQFKYTFQAASYETIQEARNMARARKAGVNTPYIMHVDTETHKIYMQYVNDAVMIKEYFYFLQRNNLPCKNR